MKVFISDIQSKERDKALAVVESIIDLTIKFKLPPHKYDLTSEIDESTLLRELNSVVEVWDEFTEEYKRALLTAIPLTSLALIKKAHKTLRGTSHPF